MPPCELRCPPFLLQNKKMVACRHDWHQTGSQVVITVYAKNAVQEQSYIEANRTTVGGYSKKTNLTGDAQCIIT